MHSALGLASAILACMRSPPLVGTHRLREEHTVVVAHLFSSQLGVNRL